MPQAAKDDLIAQTKQNWGAISKDLEKRSAMSQVDDITARAKQLGLTPEDFMAKSGPGKIWNAEQSQILAGHLTGSAQRVADLADQISKTTDPAEVQRLTAQMNLESANRLKLAAAAMGQGREAGLALQAQQKLAQAIKVGDVGLINAAQKTLGKLGVESISPEEAVKISKLYQTDPAAAHLYVLSKMPRTMGETLRSYQVMNMLSGTTTPLRVLLDSAGNMAADFGARVNSVLADTVRGWMGGDRERFPSEIPAAFKGVMTGWPKAMQDVMTQMKYGINPRDIEEFELRAGQKEVGPAWANMPKRAVVAAHLLFRRLGEESELSAQATRQAIKDMRAGEIPKEGIEARAEYYRRQPTEAMKYSAAEHGKRVSYAQKLGPIAQKLVAPLNVEIGGVKPLRLLVPFVNVAVNRMKQGLEYTPGVGMVAAIGKSGGELSDVIGRQALGATVSLPFAAMMLSDRMWGAGPKTQKSGEYQDWLMAHGRSR